MTAPPMSIACDAPVDASAHARCRVIGRCSAWLPRLMIGYPDRPQLHAATVLQRRALPSCWLHHPHYGKLGVYLSPALGAQTVADLRRDDWLEIVGRFRPVHLGRLPDDPVMLGVAGVVAVVEVLALTVQPGVVRHRQAWTWLDPPPPALLHPAPADSGGRLIALGRWPGVYYWHPADTPPPVYGTWDGVRGVVTTAPRGVRCLAYVLTPPCARGAPR